MDQVAVSTSQRASPAVVRAFDGCAPMTRGRTTVGFRRARTETIPGGTSDEDERVAAHGTQSAPMARVAVPGGHRVGDG